MKDYGKQKKIRKYFYCNSYIKFFNTVTLIFVVIVKVKENTIDLIENMVS